MRCERQSSRQINGAIEFRSDVRLENFQFVESGFRDVRQQIGERFRNALRCPPGGFEGDGVEKDFHWEARPKPWPGALRFSPSRMWESPRNKIAAKNHKFDL